MAAPLTEAAIPKTLPIFRKVAAERVHQEFVKLLMFAASSPDSLSPRNIELADWIVAHMGALFVFSAAHQPQLTYNFVDLGSGLPPKTGRTSFSKRSSANSARRTTSFQSGWLSRSTSTSRRSISFR